MLIDVIKYIKVGNLFSMIICELNLFGIDYFICWVIVYNCWLKVWIESGWIIFFVMFKYCEEGNLIIFSLYFWLVIVCNGLVSKMVNFRWV